VRGVDGAELWRLTMQHSPIGMALVDLEGRVFMTNQAIADMLGYDVDDFLERGFQEFTHPEDLDADLELFQRAMTGEIDSYRLRKRYLHTDGHVVWGDLSVAVVRGPDRSPLYFISQVLDVTEQRSNEVELETARAEIEREHTTLEAIFDTVNVGILLIDNDGRYSRMNRRHRETMSLPFPDGHDGGAGQLGHVYRLDGKTLMVREEMPSYRAANGEEFDDYTYWVGQDPQARAAFSTSARQVLDPRGERLGAVIAYQEITDLMCAMKIKDDFVASVSHELRTPLTAVLGYLEILCDDDELAPSVVAQMRVVQRNALRLQDLLADLLFMGQARDNDVWLRPSSVDLAATVAEAVAAAGPFADRREVAIDVDAPGHLSAVVDEQRIRQVVDNLLSNAVKFSPAGSAVHVRLRSQEDTDVLEVHNHGIGIDPDELDQVFTRFFRGEQAMAEQVPGTGLGLSIVDSIVTAHGGSVAVESDGERGTTFRVTLPHASP
jgi:two-component system phosphate regulon sensor histidine kinase PhoR